MCEFGMYRCALCLSDRLETHIVCDYARARNWWCERQFARCSHRERWYPPLLPACGACLRVEEVVRAEKERERVAKGSVVAGGAGIGEEVGSEDGKDKCGDEEEEGDEEGDDTQANLTFFNQTAPLQKTSLIPSTYLLPTSSTSQSFLTPSSATQQRSDSVRTTKTTDTTWEQVESASGSTLPERLSSVRVREALKDARMGVPMLRKKRWYRSSRSVGMGAVGRGEVGMGGR